MLVVTQHFAPEQNAPSYRWTHLAKEFAKAGVDVDVLTAAWGDPNQIEAPESGLTIYRVKNVLKGTGLGVRLINEFLVALKSMLKAIQVPRPDVVIVTAPPLGAMLYARPLALLLGCPLVLEMRDAWPELLDEWRSWSDYGNGPRPHLLRDLLTGSSVAVLRPILRAVHKVADMVVTTSHSYADRLRKETSRQVICIPNGRSDLPELPARDFDGELRVLYMGNIGRAQMLATAVRAAAKVQEAGGRMQLRLVGDGAHAIAVRRLAEQLNAPVEILPKATRTHVSHHYEWADSVLVLLRAWDAMELTVPSKIYEILRMRKHISASLAGESAALVNDWNAGHVVSPEDSDALAELWLRLLAEPTLMQMEPRISGTAPELNLSLNSSRYVASLQAVVAENRATRGKKKTTAS